MQNVPRFLYDLLRIFLLAEVIPGGGVGQGRSGGDGRRHDQVQILPLLLTDDGAAPEKFWLGGYGGFAAGIAEAGCGFRRRIGLSTLLRLLLFNVTGAAMDFDAGCG
jgi:hypothetical protein